MLWRIRFWLKRLFTSPEERAREASKRAARDDAFDHQMELLKNSPQLRTVEQLQGLVDTNDLQPAAQLILSRVLPCFYLVHAGSGEDAALGATRLGGSPDLPAGSEWPRGEYGYMNFYGQFALTDLRTCGAIGPGEDGHVCLFVSSQESAADPVGVHAVVVQSGEVLERLVPPADEDDYADIYASHLKPVMVTFEPGLSLPHADERFIAAITELAPEGDAEAFRSSLYNAPQNAIGQLLGYANAHSDGDLRFAVHLHRIGRSNLQSMDHVHDLTQWEELKKLRYPNGVQIWRERDEDVRWFLDHRTEIDDAAGTLQLLLRVDSNDPMGLSINDWDPIYFFIPTDRLKASDFSDMAGAVTQG